MKDFCFEILAPIVMIICVIILIILLGYLILDFSSRVKETINNKKYKEIRLEEDKVEEDDECNVQRAIILFGDERIEVEVAYYEIDDNIVLFESKDEKVYIADIKNVLLMSI